MSLGVLEEFVCGEAVWPFLHALGGKSTRRRRGAAKAYGDDTTEHTHTHTHTYEDTHIHTHTHTHTNTQVSNPMAKTHHPV